MYSNLLILLSLFLFANGKVTTVRRTTANVAVVRGLTVGLKPYAYAECFDSYLQCKLYGKVNLGTHVPEIISHYGRQSTNPTQTIKVVQMPHDVPSDIAEFLTDTSKTPYVEFPVDVIKYGKNVADLEIRMNTSLSTDSISSLPNLVNLAIGNVQNISTKAILDLPQLNKFELSNVNIKELPENVIYRCRNLKSIVIKDSTIESFSSKAFFSLFNVESLTMTGLKIGMFHDGPFVGMINLQNLVMTRSGLTTVRSSWFKFLPQLTKLDLSNNQITAIDNPLFRSLSNLKVLDLSHNQLSQLSDDSFAGLAELESLDLSNNKLPTLAPIAALDNLALFNQSYNNLLEASSNYFSALDHLKMIDLRFNQINNFTIDSMETNYTLLINVAYLSNKHYNLILSQPAPEQARQPWAAGIGWTRSGLSELEFIALNSRPVSLNDTLMKTLHCTCDWSWINENEIDKNDYYLMATKECSSDRSFMLYQYLYDTCNSTISHKFSTPVTVTAPTIATSTTTSRKIAQLAPKVQELMSSGEARYYDSDYGGYVVLSDEQCKKSCQIRERANTTPNPSMENDFGRNAFE